MVKENIIIIIPKENYKKVEEVREIKDEYKIPSYEEFMKGYESSEGVNENYELEVDSYGDIGVNKSYGPGWTERERMEDKAWKGYEEWRKKTEKEKSEKEGKGLCIEGGCWQSRKYGDKSYCGKHREEREKGRGTNRALLGATLAVTSAVCPPLGVGLTAATGATGTVAYVAGKTTDDRDLTEDGKSFLEPAIGKVVGGKVVGEVGTEIAKVFGWL